jgi:uncharacterized peroxidase-related enzyme
MTWIKTIPLSQAQGRLREAIEAQRRFYPPEYAMSLPGMADKDTGGMVAAHSLIPDALEHALSTFGVLMSPQLPLTRRQQELIAAAVSVTNRTRHCSIWHVEYLRLAGGDDELAQAVARSPADAPLDETDRAIVDYAIRITRDATQVTPADHDRLRGAGFDDVGILQITLIAAYFNYINRVADALGVGRD